MNIGRNCALIWIRGRSFTTAQLKHLHTGKTRTGSLQLTGDHVNKNLWGLCRGGPVLGGVCQRLCSQLSTENEIAEEEESSDESDKDAPSNSRTRTIVKVIDVDTSIRYMKSNAYSITYGESKVWMPYRRNYPGPYAPKKTRKTCIRAGRLSTGNPCPLCRDEYLVVHEKNVDLLKQFIDVHTGEVLSYEKTGVCQKRHSQLIIAVLRAYDQGYLQQRVPFRAYNYADYMQKT